MTAPRAARLAALVVAVARFAALAGAQPSAPPAPAGGFVLRVGTDTFAVERLTRTATSVDGELFIRAARIRVAYSGTVDAAEHVPHLTLRQWAPGAPADATPATVDFAFTPNDSLVATAGAQSRRVAVAHGAMPWVNPAITFVEQLTRAAAKAARPGAPNAPVALPAVNLANAAAFTATVTRVGADSMVVDFGDVTMRLAVDAAGNVRGGRVPAQNIAIDRAASLPASAFVAAPVPPPNYDPPAGAPYTAEEVRIPTAGGVLAGTLTVPRGRHPFPVVVTITGSGPQTRDEVLAGVTGYRLFAQVADTLGRRGVAVLRLDDRGVGASTGNFAAATSRDFADDITWAVDWLRSRGAMPGADVDPKRVALLGHSEGGLIAPLVAVDQPSLAAIVLMAGTAYDGRRVLTYQARSPILADSTLAPARRDSLLRRADAQRDALLAGSPWMRYFGAYDPLPTARRVRVPTLIVQGATDHQVTPEQADTLAAAMREGGNRDVTVRLIPETDHLFLHDPSGVPNGYAALPSKAVGPEVLGPIADWLADRLHAKTPR